MEVPTNFPSVSSSESFCINESCVKDDIANIISKMYTPVEETSGGSSDGEPSCEVYKTRKGALINEVVCETDAKTNKQFGFYFESVTASNVVRPEVESNSSDSVSLPSVKNKVKRSRNICKCCRQNIHSRMIQVRGTRACEKGNVCKHCNYYSTQLRSPSPLLTLFAKSKNKDPVGIFNKDCNEVHLNKVKHNKSAPALIWDEHTCSKQGNSLNYNKKTRFCGTSSKDLKLSGSKLKCAQHLSSKMELNNPKSTIFARFVSGLGSWPNIFRREKEVNSIKEEQNNDNIDSKITCKRHSKVSLKYQSDKSRSPCQFDNSPSHPPKLKRGCKSLLQNPKVIEAIVDEDLNKNPIQICDNLRGEHSRKSSKFDKKASKCQDMVEECVNREHRFITIQSSSEENITFKLNRAENTEEGRKDNFETQPGELQTVVEDKGNKISTVSNCQPLPFSPERVEFYCFDYGNTKYLQTTDTSPPLNTVLTVEKNSDWATMFWARVFSVFHIVLAFFTAFFLQFLKFVLHGLVRPLLWGTVQIVSDYMFKPCLTILFSSIIQPTFILLQNVTSSFRDVCLPVAQCFGYFLREVAVVFRAFRLVEVHSEKNKNPNLRDFSV